MKTFVWQLQMAYTDSSGLRYFSAEFVSSTYFFFIFSLPLSQSIVQTPAYYHSSRGLQSVYQSVLINLPSSAKILSSSALFLHL